MLLLSDSFIIIILNKSFKNKYIHIVFLSTFVPLTLLHYISSQLSLPNFPHSIVLKMLELCHGNENASLNPQFRKYFSNRIPILDESSVFKLHMFPGDFGIPPSSWLEYI